MNRPRIFYLLLALGFAALLAGLGYGTTLAAGNAAPPGTAAGQTGPTGKGAPAANATRPQASSGPHSVKLQPPAAPAAPNVVLYDQYDNSSTTATVSQDFETANDAFDSQTADDFTVPSGQNWSVTEVDAAGIYFNGSGPAVSMNVYFYQDSATLPATPVYTATGLAYTNNSGEFVIPLTTAANLTGPGTYWVSVQARMDFSAGGEWGWYDRTVQSGNPAAFRNAGGGFGCGSAWQVKTTCVTTAGGPDQVYRLVGTVGGGATASPTPTVCAVTYSVITTTGTIVPGVTDTGNHQDDGTTTINLPFPVTFYGQTYNTAIVGSNGTLGFVANGNAFTNSCLPAAAENYAILPYWDDQETVTGLPGCTAWANGCGIFTTQVGSTFYIDYHTVLFANTATALEYEIAFTQGSPDVHIVYGTPVVDTGSETIGVQQDTGSAFTQYTCNAAAGISTGLEVDFVASSCGGSTPTATPTVCAAGTPGPWTAAAPYPETIVRYGFAEVGDSFYVVGGVSNGSAVTTVYRYDVGPGTWTQLADDPGAGEALACAYNAGTNKIYCTQGINGTGFDIYDLGANTWSAGPAIPGGADRYGAAAGSSGSSVYVVGGGAAGPSTDVEVYDTGTNSWSSAAAIPTAYLLGGYQTAGQYLYVVGGYGAAPAGASRLSQAQKAAAAPDANSTGTYRLDMSTGTWDTGPAWTPSRADFGLAYVDGTLVAMGGDATGGGYFDSTNLVDQLDVSAWPGGSWTASPPLLPTPNRQANQAGFTSSDGRIWSVGGIDGSTFTFLPDNYYRAQGGACGTATPTPVGGTPTATPTVCAGGGTPGPWTSAAPITTDAYGMAMASDGTYAYEAGGYSFSLAGMTTQFSRYDPNTNSWTALAPVPDTSDGEASMLYSPSNNKLYMFGGEDVGAATVTNLTRIYDIGTNTWSTGAPMPDVRAFMASGAYNGKMYLIGGYSTGNVTPAFLQTWEYDVATDSWTTKSPIPAAVGFGGAASGVLNGHIYVAGGRDANVTVINTLWDYDIATDTWTAGANLPAADNVPGGAVVGGQFYVFGGGNPFSGTSATPGKRAAQTAPASGISLPATTNASYLYDPGSNTWSSGPSLQQARSFPGGTNIGDTAIAVGGYDGSTTTTSVELSTATGGPCGTATPTPVGASPTPTGTCVAGWTPEPDILDPRAYAGAAVVGSDLYVVSGFNGSSYADTTLRYDGSSWSAMAAIPTPISQVRDAADGTKIYVPGGFNSLSFGGPLNSMQIYDTSTDSWSMGANMPDVRSGPAVQAMNGKIYIIGGYAAGFVDEGQVWEYDPVADTYTTKTSMPATAGNVPSAVVGNEIFVLGGAPTFAHYAYNPTTDSWRTLAPGLTSDFQAGGAFVLNNQIWLIGGLGLPANQQVQVYDVASDSWSFGPLPANSHEGGSAAATYDRPRLGGRRWFRRQRQHQRRILRRLLRRRHADPDAHRRLAHRDPHFVRRSRYLGHRHSSPAAPHGARHRLRRRCRLRRGWL